MRKDAPSIALFHANIVRKNKPSIRDACIEIAPSSWNEIIGPTDVGKSDLFQHLSLRKRTSASLLMNGLNVSRMGEADVAATKRTISACAQTPLFLEGESLFNNVTLAGTVRGEDVTEQSLALLDAVGLADQLKTPICKLDFTDRMIAGAIRAVVGEASVIMIDGVMDVLPTNHRDFIVQQLKLRQISGAAIVLLSRSPSSHVSAGEVWEMNQDLRLVERTKQAVAA